MAAHAAKHQNQKTRGKYCQSKARHLAAFNSSRNKQKTACAVFSRQSALTGLVEWQMLNGIKRHIKGT